MPVIAPYYPGIRNNWTQNQTIAGIGLFTDYPVGAHLGLYNSAEVNTDIHNIRDASDIMNGTEVGDILWSLGGRFLLSYYGGGAFLSLGEPPVSSSPAISSGTVYQPSASRNTLFYIPVTYSPTTTAAATCVVALGASSSPPTIFTNSRPAGLTAADGEVDAVTLIVPFGWYFSITVTNATIGTATQVDM